MTTTIKLRRGTAAEWTTTNAVLNEGELGFEKDTNKHKIGDGVTAWNSLPYFVNENSIASIAGRVLVVDNGDGTSTVTVTGDDFNLTNNGDGTVTISLDGDSVTLGTATSPVLSVNDHTGAVVITADSIGADASGAAANAQTYAVQRGNHSGSQTASTISDLTEVVQDLVAAMMINGPNVTATYDDTAGTLTLSSTGGAVASQVDIYTGSPITWNKPSWSNEVEVICIGPGGPGGSGCRVASGTAGSGGGGGGGGGYTSRRFRAADLAASYTVTPGLTGTPGAARTADNSAGNAGIIGTNSTFGTLVAGRAGTPGGAGQSAAASTAGSGGSGTIIGSAGGIGNSGAAGSNATAGTGAAAGGGGGGGITATPAGTAGGTGGTYTAAFLNGVSGGAAGVVGTAGTAVIDNPGLGGGGGGGHPTTPGAGGVGGLYGGGGGGGGASNNGAASGAGAAGADGAVIVISRA